MNVDRKVWIPDSALIVWSHNKSELPYILRLGREYPDRTPSQKKSP